jgi:hypothetical protein
MKRINVLFLGVAVAATALFSNCKKDSTTPDAPEIMFTNGATTDSVTSGTAYTVTGAVFAGGELKSVSFTKVDASGNETSLGTAVTSFSNDTLYNFTQSLGTITATTKLKVTALDKNGLTSSALFTVKVKTVVTAGGAIYTWSAKLLGDVDNASYGSFFSSSTGDVYLAAAAKTNQTKVDFFYFYGATNLATLAALDDADAANVTYSGGATVVSGFTTKNATRFVVSSVTKADFTAATDDSKISTLTGLTLTKANKLAVDNVIGFVTASGKKGLILVKSITSTGATTKDITIDVKVQQ